MMNRPAFGDVLHVVLDDAFALVVECTRRLVEDHNARIGDQRAGNGDALALAARKARSAFAHQRVITCSWSPVRPSGTCARPGAYVQRHARSKWVVAVGDCAVDGGMFAGSDAVIGGVNSVVPVDLHVRGCPPRPLELLDGLLAVLDKQTAD
jgi:hypothetical protein